MNAEQIISVVVAILTGLSACIPLAYKLIQYVKKATQEKNWAALLGLVISLMEEAETKFTDGATRKEWVMAMVQTSAEYINYPVDVTALVFTCRSSFRKSYRIYKQYRFRRNIICHLS